MKRASLVFFDECGFMSSEAISIMEAFAVQNTDFKTSTAKNFSTKFLKRSCPTQLLYASSASDVGTTFYSYYKQFAEQMILGDNNYFCCDINCSIPLHPTMDGKPYAPLLTQDKINKSIRANKEQAMREYYNIFEKDGGVNQIIKWGTVRKNEAFILPELGYQNGGIYFIAQDPARLNDNSIIMVMRIEKDSKLGYYGRIVNCINLVDNATKKRYKLTTPNQVEVLKEMILSYNGNSPDYENIKAITIDPGSGGAGISGFGDILLDDWYDKVGNKHKGFLDNTYEAYQGFEREYPNASHILKFYTAKKYKTQMTDEFIELMNSGLIQFPEEYRGDGYVNLERKVGDEVKVYKKILTDEESMSLIQIDAAKTEITSIFKFENDERTAYKYCLPADKENKMHDDRFYCAILLAHCLYELRRSDMFKDNNADNDIAKFAEYVGVLNSGFSNNNLMHKIFR